MRRMLVRAAAIVAGLALVVGASLSGLAEFGSTSTSASSTPCWLAPNYFSHPTYRCARSYPPHSCWEPLCSGVSNYTKPTPMTVFTDARLNEQSRSPL